MSERAPTRSRTRSAWDARAAVWLLFPLVACVGHLPRVGEAAPLTEPLLPPVERLRVALPADPLDRVSTNGTSLGTVSEGRLLGGRQLPLVGPSFAVLAAHRSRKGLHHGTEELVTLVRDVAVAVAQRFPGAELAVGNLSWKRGGDSPYSISHNSGRDVDLAFFHQRGEPGHPYVPRNYLRLLPDGRAEGQPASGIRLDVPRTWALVEALLTHPTVQVQYLLIHESLRALLLEHAVASGVDPTLIHRAEQVLQRPARGGPHDDHLHVRIFCAPDDLLDGCRETGPLWPWIDRYEDVLAQRVEQLVAVAAGSRLPRALAALQRLEEMEAREVAGQLVPLLEAREPPRRVAVARTLGRLGDGRVCPVLVARLARESDLRVRLALVEGLGLLGDPAAIPALLALLTPPSPASAGRRARGADQAASALIGAAAGALAALQAQEAVPLLARSLPTVAPRERAAVALALQVLTNHAVRSTAWYRGRRSSVQLAQVRDQWLAWWERHCLEPRSRWLAAGFAAAGYPLQMPADLRQVPRLLAARSDRRLHVRQNAEAVLRDLATEHPLRPGEPLLPVDFWRSWWRRQQALSRLAG